MIYIRKFEENLPLVTLSLILFLSAFIFALSGITSSYAKPQLAAAGDWGCSSNTDQTVKSINNHGAPTTLGLGDNSYQNTPTCWYNKIKPIDGDADPSIPKKVKITIGNHDDDPSSLLTSYISHFHLPKAYYSFDREYVHVIVMNTEDPNRSNTNSAQYQFIKANLEQARANPNVKWIIVIGHQPFFTSPNGCSASSCEGSSSLTRTYQPLFDANHVDLVLWGHIHNYQRTYPLKFNSNNPLNPTKTTSAKIEYNNPTGTIYSVVGTGGVNFHSLTGQASFVVAQQANKFGQLDLSFSDDGNTMFGKFCANDPNAADPCSVSSNDLDHFRIIKTTAATSNSNLQTENVKAPHFTFALGNDPFAPKA